MARPGVSYFDVAQAANAIQATNKYPTIDLVRQKLGTGSNSTIAAHLKQWKSAHMPTVSGVQKTTIPPELVSQLQSFWEELRASAKSEFDPIETDYKDQIESLQKQNTTRREEIDELNKRLQKQQNDTETLSKELGATKEKLQKALEECSELELALLSEKSASKAKDDSITALREQLKNVTTSLEHFHSAAQKQRDEEALQHASQINRLEQKIILLEEQKSQDNGRYQQALIECEREGFKTEKMALEAELYKDQLAKKTEALTASNTKASEHRQTISELKIKLAAEADKRHKIEIENARLSTELGERSDTLTVMIAERNDLRMQYSNAINELYNRKGK